jgi:transcriptional regulator with XRE-family HTH domain
MSAVPPELPTKFHFAGARARAIREDNGEVREQVARRVPCSVATITAFELGYTVPGVEKAATIADAYGCCVDDLLVPVDAPDKALA